LKEFANPAAVFPAEKLADKEVVNMTQLDKLHSGQSAVIVSFTQDGPITRRLMELGMVAGKTITYVRKAPLRDPIQIKVGDSSVTLRKSEAALVMVELAREAILQ